MKDTPTPGPWPAAVQQLGKPSFRPYDFLRGTITADGKTLAYVVEYGDEDTQARHAADTRLMAAAPDLLVIVQQFVSLYEMWGPFMGVQTLWTHAKTVLEQIRDAHSVEEK